MAASGGVDVRGLAVVLDDHAAGGVDRLGRVHGQALVLGELAGVAARLAAGDGVAMVLPLQSAISSSQVVGGGRHQVLAVVQQAAVGGVRRGEQRAVVGGRLDGRRQQRAGVERVLALQRDDPALGRELGGPDHVDGDHVVAGVLGLEVLFAGRTAAGRPGRTAA